MSYIPVSQLKKPRKICSCAACGTSQLVLVRGDSWGKLVYSIDHEVYCKKAYWYTAEYSKIDTAVSKWNNMNKELIDGFDLVWFEIDRVYETRWDCIPVPQGVRLAA